MAKPKMSRLASDGVSKNFDYKVVLPLVIVTMFCFGFLIARNVNPSKSSLDSSDNVKNKYKTSKVADTPINLNKVSKVTITTQAPSSSANKQTGSSSGQSTVQPATTAAGQTLDLASQIKTVSPQQASGTSESESMQALKLTAGMPIISNGSNSTTKSSNQNPLKSTIQIVNNTSNSIKSAL
jgi:hypothetical protein